ncbi:MAG: hypothetical protein ACXWBT_11965 [Usitatibacter sp.]
MPFAEFAASIPARPALRKAITLARRRPETECVPALVPLATLAPAQEQQAADLARRLVAGLRERQLGPGRDNLVQGLLQEFSLSSDEGVALMCLAEALLRIPDAATRDALIRDKIGRGDWRAHLGNSASPFINAATWGLLVTGKLVAPSRSLGGTTHCAGGGRCPAPRTRRRPRSGPRWPLDRAVAGTCGSCAGRRW